MINLEKIKQEKCQPPPPLRRATPAPYFHILPPPFLKGVEGGGGGPNYVSYDLSDFPVFQSTSDYLFHVFLGRPLGKLTLPLKVLHLLKQALSSTLSR